MVVRERMKQMEGKPDKPPAKFPWLVRVFESKRKD